MSDVRFDGRVVIVTGAGTGLGRSHALGLAALGAKVVVNDLGSATDGTGASSDAARTVADEIAAQGGEAMAHAASVTDVAQVDDMVQAALSRWGRIDGLINNAGILRDKSFAKAELDDLRAVLDVHLWGSMVCSKAVWNIMKEAGYGRILMTTSASGLYGNFGQAAYSAAKMGMVGLMNTLHLEGAKSDIRVNCLAPLARTRMMEDILPPVAKDFFSVESVTTGAIALLSENAPSRCILSAGAGCFAVAQVAETGGIFLGDDVRSPTTLLARFDEVADNRDATALGQAPEQSMRFLSKAAAAQGIKL